MTRKTALALLLSAQALCSSKWCWALEPNGFVVDTGSPDALCPDLSQTRAAVARRLGALVVEGRGGWHARYTIGHAPSAANRDFVRLELFAPDNTLELERDLPMAGETCATMAEVIALVLDRHFRSLGADDARAPEPAPAPPPPKTSAPPTPVERATPHTIERVAPPAPRHTLELTQAKAALGVGLGEGFARGAPLLGLRAFGRVHSQLWLGGELELQLKPERVALRHGGEVRAVAGAARAFVAWSVPLGQTLAYVGPSAAFRLERGESRDLPQTQRQLRGVWAAGLEAGWFAPIAGRFSLQALAHAEFTLRDPSGRFYVGGEEVLRPPAFELGLGLGLSYGFW